MFLFYVSLQGKRKTVETLRFQRFSLRRTVHGGDKRDRRASLISQKPERYWSSMWISSRLLGMTIEKIHGMGISVRTFLTKRRELFTINWSRRRNVLWSWPRFFKKYLIDTAPSVSAWMMHTPGSDSSSLQLIPKS